MFRRGSTGAIRVRCPTRGIEMRGFRLVAPCLLTICGQELSGQALPQVSTREPVVVEGRVADSSGRPLRDVEVSVPALGTTTRTGGQGTFRVVVPPGSHSVRFRLIGYFGRIVDITVTGRFTMLPPVVLRTVPEQLPELVVEGRIAKPTVNLHSVIRLSAQFKIGAPYAVWDTRGASLSTESLVALRLRSPGGPLLRLYGWHDPSNGPSSWRMIGTGGCPKIGELPLAAVWTGASRDMLLLNGSGEIWLQRYWSRGPRCVRAMTIGRGQAILNATAMLDGWLVLAIDSGGAASLTHWSSAGTVRWKRSPPPFLRTRRDLEEAHLASTPLGATVASHRAPFQWIEIDRWGESRSVASVALPLDSLQLHRWTALAVLPIVDGFIQTITSPGAGERRLVVYDVLGTIVSMSGAQGAPGLIASDPTHRRLIGLRYSSAGRGRAEVVAYEY